MNILYKIRNYDKYLHFIVGICIVTSVTYFSNPVLGVLAVVIPARWKELFDKKRPDKHTVDGWDAYATVAGAPVGLALSDALVHYVGPSAYLINLARAALVSL